MAEEAGERPPLPEGNGRAWATLVVAGLLEPVWVTTMKLSDGFTDIEWAAATLVFLFLSMYMLGKALGMKVPMGTAYAVWVGIGAIGSLVVGMLLFNEPHDLMRLFFMLLIVIGIAGAQVTGK